MEHRFKKIIVVGAGPSGLLLCLLLAKHGIPVVLLEASDDLDDRPRAAIYGPPAIPDLKRAGILDEVRRQGMIAGTMAWWRMASDHREPLARLDGSVLEDVDGEDLRTTCLVLDQLDRLMLDEFLTKYKGEIKWRHKVVDVQQDDGAVSVEVETPAGRTRITGDYVVGCDGATSQVRKSLFDEFPGFTWDKQIVATNIYYDFESKFDAADSNFLIDENHFVMIAKITTDGLYRVTYGELAGLSWEEIKKRQPEIFEMILPGHPKPNEYKLVSMAPYKMHQRCAPSWGGQGITGGFVDVGGLYECLAGIWDGKADDKILDIYSEKRIEKWKNIIDAVSQDNFRRVSDPDSSSILERDPLLIECKKTEHDKERQKEMMLQSLELRYDFTQHYTSA
ncbi:hypothetical protein E8E14_003269 [Neopestalotiopsis sp. 37M]|nr:hypothetical protein E8E14_003269 [Neopestalotiopsis sp. 37M]